MPGASAAPPTARLTGLAAAKTPVPQRPDPGRRERSKRPPKKFFGDPRARAALEPLPRTPAHTRPPDGHPPALARRQGNEKRGPPAPAPARRHTGGRQASLGVTRVAARPRSASHGWPPSLARRHTGGRQASLGVKEDLGTSRHSRAPSVIPAPPPSFPRRRESGPPNPDPASAIPAKRDPGMTRTGTESQPRPGNPAGSEAARFPSSRE